VLDSAEASGNVHVKVDREGNAKAVESKAWTESTRIHSRLGALQPAVAGSPKRFCWHSADGEEAMEERQKATWFGANRGMAARRGAPARKPRFRIRMLLWTC